MNQREDSHCKEPPPADGEDDKQQMRHAAEQPEKQGDYQNDGEQDSEDAVGLNLAGITDSDDRSACEVDTDRGE